MDGSLSILLGVLLIAGLGIAAYYGIPTIYKKNEIVFELDDRYTNLKDLREATVEYLKKEGKSCEVIDSRILRVNGEKYILMERTIGLRASVPVQQVVLKRCK